MRSALFSLFGAWLAASASAQYTNGSVCDVFKQMFPNQVFMPNDTQYTSENEHYWSSASVSFAHLWTVSFGFQLTCILCVSILDLLVLSLLRMLKSSQV